jgi:hypothetical protein
MTRDRWQYLMLGLSGFDAVSAVVGGALILAGVDRFPTSWLQNTPFKDFTIPALTLTIVVGGSSLSASIALVARFPSANLLASAAGALMVGWIGCEVAVINAPKPSATEIVYAIAGALLLGLGLWRHSRRARSVTGHHD